jgi:signal transduction histidine kinase
LIHFISHEVKGYLTKSEGAFSALVEGDFGVLPDEAKGIAHTALSEDRKGVKAVMDILQAANLKSGAVNYAMKEFDLALTLRALAENFIKDAAEARIQFEVGIPNARAEVMGDEAQLRDYVFGNVLKNLVAYAPGARATLSLSVQNGRALVRVADTGPGIAPDDMRRLFLEGGKGKDSMKVNVHSTGYGLFIAKQIVEAHHGRIWAESAGPGKGSVFFVELPLAKRKPQQECTPAGAARN